MSNPECLVNSFLFIYFLCVLLLLFFCTHVTLFCFVLVEASGGEKYRTCLNCCRAWRVLSIAPTASWTFIPTSSISSSFLLSSPLFSSFQFISTCPPLLPSHDPFSSVPLLIRALFFLSIVYSTYPLPHCFTFIFSLSVSLIPIIFTLYLFCFSILSYFFLSVFYSVPSISVSFLPFSLSRLHFLPFLASSY